MMPAATLVAATTATAAPTVETAPAKAAAVVETAAESKPDPDGNGHPVAISAIEVIRFGISVVGASHRPPPGCVNILVREGSSQPSPDLPLVVPQLMSRNSSGSLRSGNYLARHGR
jgi:hypothetical protein